MKWKKWMKEQYTISYTTLFMTGRGIIVITKGLVLKKPAPPEHQSICIFTSGVRLQDCLDEGKKG